ncbi:MAG: hypothetical protein EOP04_16245 [Proteobacteria bacterium]|nr:MAG: hypothetical protein EOP04_16245 [Pseudomonadota bacterium]
MFKIDSRKIIVALALLAISSKQAHADIVHGTTTLAPAANAVFAAGVVTLSANTTVSASVHPYQYTATLTYYKDDVYQSSVSTLAYLTATTTNRPVSITTQPNLAIGSYSYNFRALGIDDVTDEYINVFWPSRSFTVQ